MKTELDSLNDKLSTCLKEGLMKTDSQASEASLFFKTNMVDLKIFFDKPILAPCYILFGMADALNVTAEVYAILSSYELAFLDRKKD